MRSNKSLILAALVALPAAAGAEDAIQFAPPPVAMINLTSNDAVHTNTFDYMNLKLSGFNLHALNFGMGVMERKWEKGGWNRLMASQFIFGEADVSEMSGGMASGSFNMFGFGNQIPVNLFFDPLSEDTDDASLPIYGGLHLGYSFLMGSFSMDFPYFDWDTMSLRYRKSTTTIATLSYMAGWQMGIQAGINLGEYIKFVPYVDISQELYMGVSSSMSSTYGGSSSTNSGNLGPMPVSLMPGFDLILRKYGLSLGGAYKTMEQDSGDMKMFNLHFRFTKKFKSICG